MLVSLLNQGADGGSVAGDQGHGQLHAIDNQAKDRQIRLHKENNRSHGDEDHQGSFERANAGLVGHHNLLVRLGNFDYCLLYENTVVFVGKRMTCGSICLLVAFAEPMTKV
jgi:hypothetical protein